MTAKHLNLHAKKKKKHKNMIRLIWTKCEVIELTEEKIRDRNTT